MTQERPITPPSELAAQWVAEIYGDPVIRLHPITLQLVERAAQWGADQELEACCNLLELSDSNARDFLQSARRPKPPSKQEALDELYISFDRGYLKKEAADIIRRALEQLPDNE
jgi:hypothetical protein